MSLLTSKEASPISLAETDCSITVKPFHFDQEKKYSKKRIGPYSFYFKNLIGTGYSSKVYSGIKDNNK
jgi:hypothetical protein